MRRNRKIKRHATWTTGSMAVATLIVCMLLMMLVYWLFDSRCSAIQREIGKAEKVLAALEADCVRETARWDEMMTPEKLAECLTRFGLEMKTQHQDQIVRMNRDGRPAPNQIAVIRAQMRARGENMASYKTTGARATSSQRTVAKPRGTRR
ncbi:MAG: hypothetical protein IKL96_12670 [Kiritimatiellae bacterium]|nr:hypothetical protein [Kiritimatiellia bacterium]